MNVTGVSEHANFYPMLDDGALAELVADIKENGLQEPITVNADGVLLDGRNRLAACERAGVEPVFRVFEGEDEGAFVRSSNERRHQSTGSRAMSTALSLQADGLRKNGRWKRGSVDITGSGNSDWRNRMNEAGTVLDYGRNMALDVVAGNRSLDEAYKLAKEEKQRQEEEERAKLEAIKDEQTREDQAGRYFDNHPDAQAWLDSKPQGAFETMRGAYAAYLEYDREALAEKKKAEAEEARKERERQDGMTRVAKMLESFLRGYDAASHLRDNPHRVEILEKLDKSDRTKFLEIEKDLKWNL